MLSACVPAASETPAPTATLEPTATMSPSPTAAPLETVAAVSSEENAPSRLVLPEYTRVILEGYPIANHVDQPQIFIYPLQELGKVNEDAGKAIASLQTLLLSPQEIPNMPFLPPTGDVQIMHAQLQYLDFKNGQGLRYLTEYGNGISPIHRGNLI